MFLERLRERFTRTRGRPLDEEAPRSRGGLISICVLIAVVLWLTLSMRETYTVQLEMPTQVVNLPEGMALVEQPPSTVLVQVQGEGLELLNLRFDPPTVQIDARADEVADEDLAISLPKDVLLEGISPRTFSLRKERSIARTIPIRLLGLIETKGSDELLHPPRLEPDSLLVSGARSIVSQLDAWPTVPILERVTNDSLVVRVPLADTLSGLVRRSHTATTVTAVSRPFTEARRRIRVQVTGVPSNQRVVSLEPSSVNVTYRVPVSQFDEAQRAPDFLATVSYDEIRADTTGRIRPEVQPPQDLLVRIVDVDPSTLRYYERLVEQ